MLLQLVAKRLLADYAGTLEGRRRRRAGQLRGQPGLGDGGDRFGLRRALGGGARHRQRAAQRPLVQAARCAARTAGRVRQMVADVASELRSVAKLSPQQQARFNEHQYEIINAAKATQTCCCGRPSPTPWRGSRTPGTAQVFTWLRDIFALSRIEDSLGWYLSNGRISSQRARTLGPYINRLVARVRPTPKIWSRASCFARSMCAWRSPPARRRHGRTRPWSTTAACRASSDAPVDEKVLVDRKRAAEKSRKK